MTEKEEHVKPSYWAVIPAAVRYDADLPSTAKLLYAEISSLTNDTGYCYASNRYFELNFELSTRTIERLLGRLAEKGYIVVENNDGGRKERRIYAGINPLGRSATPAHVPPDKNDGGAPDKNDGGAPTKMTGATILTIKKNTHAPKEPCAPVDWKPERFEGLWKFYPKTENDSKARARKAWNKLKPSDETIQAIARGLQHDMKSDAWQRGIAIPYLSTYLNQRRWEDACERADIAVQEGFIEEDPGVVYYD